MEKTYEWTTKQKLRVSFDELTYYYGEFLTKNSTDNEISEVVDRYVTCQDDDVFCTITQKVKHKIFQDLKNYLKNS